MADRVHGTRIRLRSVGPSQDDYQNRGGSRRLRTVRRRIRGSLRRKRNRVDWPCLVTLLNFHPRWARCLDVRLHAYRRRQEMSKNARYAYLVASMLLMGAS